MKYERYTEKRNGKNVIPLRNAVCGVGLPKWNVEEQSEIERFLSGDAVDRLAELEDKIENGEIVYPKYPIYSNVYIIDFLGENGYSVHNGKPVVRECFVTSITQITRTATSALYRVQPHKLPREVMNGDVDNEFWDRGFYERDLFSTPEEAEKRLKELQE